MRTTNTLSKCLLAMLCLAGVAEASVGGTPQASTSDLLQAKVIVIGKVDALDVTGKSALDLGYAKVPVIVKRASLSGVQNLLMGGADFPKSISVTPLFVSEDPEGTIARTEVEPGKTYVWFLTAGPDKAAFTPFHEEVCAIPVDVAKINPEYGFEAQPLLNIAVGNALGEDKSASVRWARFLSELPFDPKVQGLMESFVKEDKSPPLQGLALTWFCRNTPLTGELLAQIFDYANKNYQGVETGQITNDLLYTLEKESAKCTALDPSVLVKQLTSESRLVKVSALGLLETWFTRKEALDMSPALLAMLKDSSEPQVQYATMRLFARMLRIQLPGIEKFQSDPAHYIEQVTQKIADLTKA